MVRVYNGNGLGDFYYDLLRDLTNEGRKVTIRGHECLEMRDPVALVYEKPGHCWMNIPGRRFNPFFAIAEVYWILMGMGNIEWIAYYNKRMRDFNDGGPENHGAYGLRIRHWRYNYQVESYSYREKGVSEVDQIFEVVRKLKEDPYTRQAIISLWDPVRDNLIKSKDIPCNNQISYSLRDGVLNQTVVIRSNDLVWGTPYNAVQFSHLHALVAGMLNVEIGTLTYFVENLHYYFNLYKPTLANLLEHAFLREDRPENPGAEVVSNFGTVDDKGLLELEDNVNYIHSAWSQISWTPLRQAHFSGSGYWNQTIPLLLWIHRILKEGTEIESEDRVHLAERILTLGNPLTDLIIDFLEESTLEIPSEVANLCRQLYQPSNG